MQAAKSLARQLIEGDRKGWDPEFREDLAAAEAFARKWSNDNGSTFWRWATSTEMFALQDAVKAGLIVQPVERSVHARRMKADGWIQIANDTWSTYIMTATRDVARKTAQQTVKNTLDGIAEGEELGKRVDTSRGSLYAWVHEWAVTADLGSMIDVWGTTDTWRKLKNAVESGRQITVLDWSDDGTHETLNLAKLKTHQLISEGWELIGQKTRYSETSGGRHAEIAELGTPRWYEAVLAGDRKAQQVTGRRTVKSTLDEAFGDLFQVKAQVVAKCPKLNGEDWLTVRQ